MLHTVNYTCPKNVKKYEKLVRRMEHFMTAVIGNVCTTVYPVLDY